MPISKPQQTLQLGLNVLIEAGCEGCNFHNIPYTFNSIISEDRDEIIKINNDLDIWNYIKNLKTESMSIRKNGNQNTILEDLFSQLPFFCCVNFFIDSTYQHDINKYFYSIDASVPVYPGTYYEQPKLWLEKYYVIKNALIVRSKMINNKIKMENKKK